MLQAKSAKTYQQYSTYWSRWEKYCQDQEVDALTPPIAPVVNFLQNCREEYSLGYSAVNTARSALSMIVSCEGAPLSQNEDLSIFMKGVRNQSPHLPKYSAIWDADLLLNYLNSMGAPQDLNLKDLTIKLAALLLISSGQRVQTLEHLSIDNLFLSPDLAQFSIMTKLKHTKNKGTEVSFKSFPGNRNLCAVSHLSQYLQITRPFRQSPQLFLSYQKPHNPVVSQSISRWIRTMLAAAGIDLNIFGAHSIRASSTAAAKRGGATLDTILQAGSWARASTFATWYDKPILQNTPSFQDALLSNHSQ